MAVLFPKDAVVRLQNNEDKFDKFINTNLSNSYTSSNGQIVESIPHFMDRVSQEASVLINSLGYLVPVVYSAGISLTSPRQTISYNNVTYAPIANQLPFITSGSFETTKFRVIQGITAADAAAPSGSSLFGFRQNAVAAIAWDVESELQTRVGVWQWGAHGLGDDTTKIQAAIDFCKTFGVTRLQLSPWINYTVSAKLKISGSFGMRGLIFDGNNASIAGNHNGVIFESDPSGVNSGDSAPEYRQNLTVQNLRIVGIWNSSSSGTNTATVGFQITHGAGVRLNNVSISGCYRNLYGYGALICNFENVKVSEGFYGVDMSPAPVEGFKPAFNPNDLHFHNLKSTNNKRAFRATDFPSGSISFYGCEFEGINIGGNTTDGVLGIQFFNAGKVTMIAPHIEDMAGQVALSYHGANPYCYLNLIGGEIIPGDNCGRALHLNNAGVAANAGNLNLDGTRVSKNGGDSIYFDEGFKFTIRGNPLGTIGGDLSNGVFIMDGKQGVGGRPSDVAALKVSSSTANPIALDLFGMQRFVDAGGNRTGYFSDNSASIIVLSDAGRTLRVVANGNPSQAIELGRLNTATLEPGSDNAMDLGTAALRFKQVHAGTATIDTSDGRLKSLFNTDGKIDPAVMRAWRKVSFVQYQFLDAVAEKGPDGARWHFGAIAQAVEAAFKSEGLDGFRYGLLCYDEWEDHFQTIIDAHGNPTKELRKVLVAGNRYGLRYEESLVLECAMQRQLGDERDEKLEKMAMILKKILVK